MGEGGTCMFEHRSRAQSNAEYVRNAAAARITDAARWERENETWFTGSVESIDDRLALCDRLMHAERAKLARGGLTSDSGRALIRMGDFQAQRDALVRMRENIVTAATYLQEPSRKTASRPVGPPGSPAQRYVDLTAARLVREADLDTPAEELGIRARYRVAEETSKLGPRRCAALTQAVEELTIELASHRPKPRVAAAAPEHTDDLPSEWMFL